MRKFMIVLSNDDFTEVKLVHPRYSTVDNDEALELEVAPDFMFRSIVTAIDFIRAQNINLVGEFVGAIY